MGIKWSSLLGLQSYLQMISVSKEGIAGCRPPAFETIASNPLDHRATNSKPTTEISRRRSGDTETPYTSERGEGRSARLAAGGQRVPPRPRRRSGNSARVRQRLRQWVRHRRLPQRRTLRPVGDRARSASTSRGTPPTRRQHSGSVRPRAPRPPYASASRLWRVVRGARGQR
jgi:hypothetical protein